MTAIDVSRLSKRYGDKRAVDDLTFQVRPGRVTGFLGPNGAGKSTTLRLVLGLDRPTSGSATVGGRAYTDIDEPLRTVGALLDAQAAHGSRSAYRHLSALAVSNRLPRTRVDAVLEESGIASAADRRIKTFSLGMRQRLGVAAALLGDPEVVILDEPANGLDPEGIVWIRELLRRLAREGRTVLVSSHLMNETAGYADHLVVLGRGRLLADAPMAEFLHTHGESAVRLRTSRPDRLRPALARAGHTALETEDGTLRISGADAGEIGQLAAEAGAPLLELATDTASLEDAYFALTEKEAEFASSTRTEN
ncbi:ATP-binding cassette domain-containing protein [Streptomyces sp. NA04227]|uniref:ABC transporter ATP-binding protein n=1 Tax=Streptomyces sp. NA04227 TaxID=2742136 RepID=UPI001591FEFC|nr:ATP-binding cassette domain-containing protein [Streptomyces sp. NA04227]QKW05320.1 ATP-binding cassette domain-containing protein [Streptomyces sp. NA04227]